MILWNTSPEIRGQSLQLVVAVHAWLSSSAKLSDIHDAVAQEMPDADLLFPDYPAGLISSADLIQITDNLVDAITNAVEARQNRGNTYQEIILIGHSLGALLVRKAYVFANGETQDRYGPLVAPPRTWAPLVSRIILLAGTNRGWSLSKKARDMSWARWIGFSACAQLWRWLRLGKLINSARRGAPFVVNLRIQWLNLVRSPNPLAVTIQLLGDVDDIVDEEDNVDVQSGANFIYRRVTKTGHANVICFSGSETHSRREQFLYALTTPLGDLKSDFIKPLEPDYTVQQIVFVMHGIRDFGHWTRDVGRRVAEIAASMGKRVQVITSGYGYFPMIGFLLQPERQRNVRWFMDQYTEALARFPKATISYIGHSNGTYLLASALKRYDACVFDRVVFAGSVVPATFPWDQLVNQEKRLAAIQNYVATNDWVVGIFPRVFEYLSASDLGSAGHNGFVDHEGRQHQITFIKGKHAAALQPENYGTLARFVLGDGSAVPPLPLLAKKQAKITVIASKLCWLIWIGLLVATVAPVLGPWLLWINGLWQLHWGHWWMLPLVWPPLLYALLCTV